MENPLYSVIWYSSGTGVQYIPAKPVPQPTLSTTMAHTAEVCLESWRWKSSLWDHLLGSEEVTQWNKPQSELG